MLKHLLPVACQVLGVNNRGLDVILTEQVLQGLLALDLGELAKVAVTPQQIEGVIDQSILPARGQLCLQLREVGPPFIDDHDLPVDDGLTRNIEGAGNGREPLGPVQTVAGKDLLLTAVDVDLDAVAVELDLVKPLLTLRSFGLQRCKLGSNETRHS